MQFYFFIGLIILIIIIFRKKIIEYIKIINKFIVNKINYLKPISLSPVSNVKNSSLIMLKKAIRDKRNKNIALAGKYGAGKSSIIKSYFNGISGIFNRILYKPIFISLGMLGISCEKDEVNTISQEIERGIIQQIIYKEDGTKFPESQIKRMSKLKVITVIKIIILFFIIYAFWMYTKINNYTIEKLYDIFINLKNFDYHNIFKLIDKNASDDIKSIRNDFIFVTGVIVIIYIAISKIYMLINNIGIKIHYKQAEIEISTAKNESLFNKYMDELIYFFSNTKYKIVVIEDLDRFMETEDLRNKVLIIFQKLKELNQILNESKQVSRKFKFIYLVKDDLFENSKERIKFFDVIVPVIPIISNYNSYAELKKYFDYENISDKLLQDISPYILENRQIINIKNEYDIYKEEIKGIEIDVNKLLAMITLKNIEPNIFEDLLNDNEESAVYKILNNKNELIDKLLINYNKKIDDNNRKINDIKNEKLKSEQELKKIVLYDLKEKRYEMASKPTITEQEFLSEDYDIEKIKENEILIRHNPNNYMYNEGTVFSYFSGGKEEFIKRLEAINNSMNDKIELINDENQEMNNKKNVIRTLPLNVLLKLVYVNSNFIDNKISQMLISNGYIDESYKDYMYKFISSNKFTKKDQEFMSIIRQNKKIEYDYEVDHMKNVIEELNEDYFLNENILNFYLVKELLVTESFEGTKKKNRVIGILTKNNEVIQDFICKFYDLLGDDLTNNLFKELNQNDDNCILNLIKSNELYKKEFIMIIINNLPNLLDNDNLKDYIKEYIEYNDIYFEKWCKIFDDDTKKSIIKLDIKFKNLDDYYSENFIKFIISNKLYIPNYKMMRLIFRYFEISNDIFNTAVLTEIEKNEDLKAVREVVYNNKKIFIEDCYLRQIENKNDIGDIIGCINSWNLDEKTLEKIIINLPKKIEVSEKFNSNVVTILLRENKVHPNWDNYFYVYKLMDNKLNDSIINNIENNIDVLMNESIYTDNLKKDNQEYIKFRGEIARNNNIKINIYMKLIPKICIIINSIEEGEIEKNRLKFLIQNNIIKFNNSNFKIIYREIPEMLDFYINKNLKEFIENINEYTIIPDIVNIIMNSNIIKKADKIRIANITDIDLLNENALEGLANDFKNYTKVKLSQNIIEKIISSKIDINTKIRFIIKLNIHEKEVMKNYIKDLDKPYCYIENYDSKKTVSFENNELNIFFINMIEDLNFNISKRVFIKTIVVYNKNSKKMGA